MRGRAHPRDGQPAARSRRRAVGVVLVLVASIGANVAGSLGAGASTPGPAHQLAFTSEPPPTARAGQAFSFEVAVEDATGNVTPSSDQIAVAVYKPYPAPASLSCTTGTTHAAVSGIARFSCSTTTAEAIQLVASDVTEPAVFSAYSYFVTVRGGTPHALAWHEQPESASLGVAFPVEVSVVDTWGNVAQTDSTSVVTLALTIGTGSVGATLSCTSRGAPGDSATVSYGTASFQCTVSEAGTGYTLTGSVTSPALPSIVSSAFTIGQESATIVAAPDPAVVTNLDGTSFDVTVTVDSAARLPLATHRVTLAFTSFVGTAHVTPQNTGKTNATGVATFGVSCLF